MKSARFHVKSGRFHVDFMKSTGFHVKSKDHLQGIVTLCFMFFPYVTGTAGPPSSKLTHTSMLQVPQDH